MFRTARIWVPALALLGAASFASIALTSGGESAVPAGEDGTAPDVIVAVATATTTADQPTIPREEAVPSAPSPVGVLTYVTRDGSYVAIDAADPSLELDVIEPPSGRAVEKAAGVYPSPDGRYDATIRRDAMGVWIDVLEGERLATSRQVAGPDAPETVDAPKSLAAAVDGVPLNVAWSPDGSYLAYGSLTGAPFSLAIIRTDTWATLYRDVEGGYVGELAWAPDSRHLAISTYELDRRDHTVLIYDPQRAIVRHLIDGCAIVWAPDSAFLAVHREPSVDTGVWITSPTGDTRIEATADESAFPVAWVARSS